MEFKTLQVEKLSDKVVKEIIHMLETGALKPGDKLPPEVEFAEQLGVSRGILREALTILQSQGYISRKPKDGTYIRKLPNKYSRDESVLSMFKKATYRDLLEMRESLEQKVVELVIERATDDDIMALEKMLMETELTEEKSIVVDHDFHLKLAELSQNILIINFIDIYYNLIHELAEISLKNNKQRRIEIIKEHMEIVKAIKERNIEKAKKAVIYHLNAVKETINTVKETTDNIESD
ncbi:GntR family transcriptional repressor for pyruvate dehydrogenase complex [Caldicoprobacter guelmensis]|uniref:FadR/GntR family transcriptional regulator n=1 Tax=Caldicoprobacter guelmensis TaxID=1170224 RepID=UPI00195BC932|nr:FadR/GntR family transcriptional regulator [Caldicoprobacter guelmensis]MBM7582955.1 GntR family transcriptional repressor for pyruvate dehydrogenase complex [Caldicoprobacter guelmensis]